MWRRLRFLKPFGMFWVGYWAAFFLWALDEDRPGLALFAILMSGINLWNHERAVHRIMQELNEREKGVKP